MKATIGEKVDEKGDTHMASTIKTAEELYPLFFLLNMPLVALELNKSRARP
jgi:hypothetical protein